MKKIKRIFKGFEDLDPKSETWIRPPTWEECKKFRASKHINIK